ncbi:hypothetical protein, partial [Vibrio sp. LB10LO1]|uniref:hypothetical protein n=1 Tax=Vibrio sp. LB10LO1 TaxID=2711207 RepID=UPI0019679D96
MKFSHRFGFDPEYKNEPISQDAPNWLKNMFFLKVLEPLLYVDGDSRVSNCSGQQIPDTDLSRFSAST